MARPRVNNGRRRALPYVAAQSAVLDPVNFLVLVTTGGFDVVVTFSGPVNILRPFTSQDAFLNFATGPVPLLTFVNQPSPNELVFTSSETPGAGVSFDFYFPPNRNWIASSTGAPLAPASFGGLTTA